MVIFLAPIFTEEILLKYKSTSPAASLWCSTFASQLEKFEKVFCISAINSSAFPKGNFFIAGYEYFHPIQTKMVPFIGFPFLRLLIIKFLIRKKVKEILKHTEVSYIITYNSTKVNVAIAKYFQNKGIKWINLYADANSDKQLVTNADYHIFFSYNSFVLSRLKDKYVFEGAVYRKVNLEFNLNDNKIFLYTGKITKANGVDLMLDAFKLLENKNASLIICGSGGYSGFIEKVKSDTRIIFYGLLDNETLKKLYCESSFFLNPRLSSYEENNNNFPSKILDYLSYAKPILTTNTKGMNPMLLKYMFVLEKETPEEFMKLMGTVINLTYQEKERIHNDIKDFVNNCYNWDNRFGELWDWVSQEKK